MTENKRLCKYCKHLLINLIGSTQTCLKLNTYVEMDESCCVNFEFSQKMYNQIKEYEKELKS